MNSIRLVEFITLDEARQREVQLRCGQRLDDLLDHLLGLVLVAEMPDETRAYFARGIAHLRGHIHAETHELQAEEGGWLNCRFV